MRRRLRLPVRSSWFHLASAGAGDCWQLSSALLWPGLVWCWRRCRQLCLICANRRRTFAATCRQHRWQRLLQSWPVVAVAIVYGNSLLLFVAARLYFYNCLFAFVYPNVKYPCVSECICASISSISTFSVVPFMKFWLLKSVSPLCWQLSIFRLSG